MEAEVWLGFRGHGKDVGHGRELWWGHGRVVGGRRAKVVGMSAVWLAAL